MNILYLGDNHSGSTSFHRANALRRLGHKVVHVDPRAFCRASKLIPPLAVRFGFGFLSPIVNSFIKKNVDIAGINLAWIDTGAEINGSLHRWFVSNGVRIINYNVDDPFGDRDGRKWNLYRKSLRFHDVTAVVREENIQEAKAYGARNVVHVFRSYDPVAHAPVLINEYERKKWASEVSFVGTWMPERGSFMVKLIELGVPLTIQGQRWWKAPEWERLKHVWRGPSVFGRDYSLAIQCSRVTIGLLSKGNRDLHTTRSAEVPFMGGAAFCGERTREHLAMFQEGQEAEFWSTPEECAEKCFSLLSDETRRRKLVAAAQAKVIASRLSNDEIMQSILSNLEHLR